jgi:hypothetical protein
MATRMQIYVVKGQAPGRLALHAEFPSGQGVALGVFEAPYELAAAMCRHALKRQAEPGVVWEFVRRLSPNLRTLAWEMSAGEIRSHVRAILEREQPNPFTIEVAAPAKARRVPRQTRRARNPRRLTARRVKTILDDMSDTRSDPSEESAVERPESNVPKRGTGWYL